MLCLGDSCSQHSPSLTLAFFLLLRTWVFWALDKSRHYTRSIKLFMMYQSTWGNDSGNQYFMRQKNSSRRKNHTTSMRKEKWVKYLTWAVYHNEEVWKWERIWKGKSEWPQFWGYRQGTGSCGWKVSRHGDGHRHQCQGCEGIEWQSIGISFLNCQLLLNSQLPSIYFFDSFLKCTTFRGNFNFRKYY